MPDTAATSVALDDLPALAGKDLGVSRWVTITQDQIDTFAMLSGDRQWIHVDPERARTARSAARSPTASSRSRCPLCCSTNLVDVVAADPELRPEPGAVPGAHAGRQPGADGPGSPT